MDIFRSLNGLKEKIPVIMIPRFSIGYRSSSLLTTQIPCRYLFISILVDSGARSMTGLGQTDPPGRDLNGF
jgi:hypothetical protein